MQPGNPDLPGRIQTVLLALIRTFESHGVQYALIGGVASGFRGSPRFTEDVDMLVRIPQLKLPGVLQELQSQGFELDLHATIREWNQQHLTLIRNQDIAIDWLKPVLPCLEHALERASAERWLNTSVRIVCAEDLIVLKVLSFRVQDQLDIQNLLAANAGLLDLQLIRHELQDALPESDERLQGFENLVLKQESQDGPQSTS